MEENENNVQNVENTTEPIKETTQNTETQNVDNQTVGEGNRVVASLKAKKALIALIAIVVIVVLILVDAIFTSPKEAVKGFISAINSAKSEKAFKYIDFAGIYVFSELDDDEYEDFWDKYEEFKDDDDYEDMMDEAKENMDDEFFEDMDDQIEDSEMKIKVKSIESVKKVGKNLYVVKTKIKATMDDEDETKTVKIYVMKKGFNSYIVGFGSGFGSLSSLTSLF